MLLISFKRTTSSCSKQPNLTEPFPLGSPYVDGFAFENSLYSFLHFGGWTDLPVPFTGTAETRTAESRIQVRFVMPREARSTSTDHSPGAIRRRESLTLARTRPVAQRRGACR
jgi:hypothetical protein